MKKACQYALTAMLIVVIVGVIVSTVCFLNFMKPGVHSFAGYTRLDFQQKVYFVDANSQEVIGNSIVTISGLVQPAQSSNASKSFRGSISVQQYPMAFEHGYVSLVASSSKGVISVTSLSIDNSTQTNVTYWLHMSKENPDIYAVYIYLTDGTTLTAYPGQTEQEAVANCEAYWQWFRTLQ